MNHTLYHRVEQIRDSLTEARKTATDPKLIEALTAGIDDLNAFLLDLNDDEQDEEDRKNHPLVIVTTPEPLDLHAEIRRLFLAPAHMSVVAG